MASRRRIRAFAMLALLTGVVACSTTGGTPGAQSVPGPASSAATTASTADPTATTAPGPSTDGSVQVESATDPATEGTGPESARPPDNQPAITLPVPSDDSTPPVFDVEFDESSTTGCLEFATDWDVPGGVWVVDIGVEPADGFSRDDSPCTEYELCEGFTFPGGTGSCRAGVRWDPASGVAEGSASLLVELRCDTQDGEVCRELDEAPPAGGVLVQLLLPGVLLAYPSEPSSGPETTDEGPTSDGTTPEGPTSGTAEGETAESTAGEESTSGQSSTG